MKGKGVEDRVRHERRIVAFLMKPGNYPHAVQAIRHYETHISHVFVAGDFAYKLKKPLRFSFLDATTPALRKKWGRLEVHLNRRLAPSLYLGIIPISQRNGKLCFGKEGDIIEWIVKMQRLPEDLMLDRMISKNKVSRPHIRRLVVKLTEFFRQSSWTKAVENYGAPEKVKSRVMDNLSECRAFIPKLITEAEWYFLDSAYKQYITLCESLFKRRLHEHRIIDGHGDLRCENICLTDPVTIFDCVEFEPAFRRGDIAKDFAFLLMDLEIRGRADLAQIALNTYLTQTRDRCSKDILPFYKCHHSLVRGKVRALAWLQHPRSAKGKRMRTLSQRHFRLALRYARQFTKPQLIIVGGLIGTGKSTLAKQLANELGAAWLRTDEIRMKEFTLFNKPNREFNKGLYLPSISRKVYQRLIKRADRLLRGGRSVICDGTFSQNRWRVALKHIAGRHHASFHFFECVIPRRIAVRRLAARYAAKEDLSEAKPEYYDKLRARFEPITRSLTREYSRLMTAKPSEAVLKTALDYLQDIKQK